MTAECGGRRNILTSALSYRLEQGFEERVLQIEFCVYKKIAALGCTHNQFKVLLDTRIVVKHQANGARTPETDA